MNNLDVLKLKINVDWLDKLVYVFIVEDVTKFRNGEMIKLFPKLSKMENKDSCSGLHTYEDDYPFYQFIVIKNGSDYGVIAHECYHCVCSIYNQTGIDNEEATAYLLDYLVRRIQRKIETL